MTNKQEAIKMLEVLQNKMQLQGDIMQDIQNIMEFINNNL